ncbi:MAG: response regulator [Verrucomicrobia bacterium]|nr:response regulator [Verrucomicrobiota bacterium]
MSNDAAKRNRILFVDDDEAFLSTVRDLFDAFSNGDWEVHGALSGAKAMALLQESPVDLVVTDLQMPVMDGVQLIQFLKKNYPAIPKAVLSSRTDPSARDSCMQAGADLFFIKPTDINVWDEIFASLRQLVSVQPKEGFRGVMRRIGLQEVIQLECLGTKSSVLEVKAGDIVGEIFIRDGRIIHARVGDREGLEAFNRIMAFNSGEFGLKAFAEPPVETISGSWEMLLMEAARVRDEAAQPSATGEPPTAAEVAVTAQARAAASDAAEAVLAGEQGPQVEEILICTTKGDVVYEWQSPQADARMEIISFIKKWTQQLNRKLPLGRLRDTEFVNQGDRLVFKLADDWTMLVRTRRVATPSGRQAS